ncbi:sulfate transporter [Marinomonas primoryensis]|uniref:Sulfate transporter n=1 Tax=Marinomonas primoryensis TaxID=178399 RepID=A0A2Z4PXX7_9GAMM|nr:DUF3164 family protein [Marinomonas primoryensis]AWX98703.1 sulfate transporter [Marinomonas primoryensis]AWY02220.1 sulfate transporter [Marinomonas primoryensis]
MSTSNQQDNVIKVPEGMRVNADGYFVPETSIREQDLLRDQIVMALVPEALSLSCDMAAYKAKALADISDLIEIAADRYGAKLGGKKGNVSLVSFDGRYKIQRTYREVVAFTEEIEAAKALIDSCLIRWSEGASDNIRAVVSQAFRKNRNGEISTGKVLDLMRMEIDDEEWSRAMNALKDALKSNGTAVYIRVYERIGTTDQYKPISLDIASL